ncbi:MAG: CADD family putative folate metabolism protein [Anaerolineae bacterium]
MSIMDRADDLIAQQRLLDHPFYSAWSEGRLSREAIEAYAGQYFHWVNAFPTFLSLTHAQCPDLTVRQEILENLNDEEMGPDNHPELWLRFCDALGLDRADVRANRVFPETQEAIDSFRAVCGSGPFVAGLAALYAYEAQQPEVAAEKRRGLTNLYDLPDGHDFFVEHETADVAHSAAERRLIEANVNGDGAAILEGVQAGLDAVTTLLDGVHQRFVA